jgi:hypothetical protein
LFVCTIIFIIFSDVGGAVYLGGAGGGAGALSLSEVWLFHSKALVRHRSHASGLVSQLSHGVLGSNRSILGKLPPSSLLPFSCPLHSDRATVPQSRYETCLKEEGSNSTIICHEPFNYIDSQGLKGIWELVYWSTFVLTWAVFPLMQAYSVSGAFTMLTRLKEAIRFNLLYYGIAVALALILAIIIIVKDGW